jgi:hypothetical protein
VGNRTQASLVIGTEGFTNGYTFGQLNRVDTILQSGPGIGSKLIDDDYLYDREGRRTARYVDQDENGHLSASDTGVTLYAWDHRGRPRSSHAARHGRMW